MSAKTVFTPGACTRGLFSLVLLIGLAACGGGGGGGSSQSTTHTVTAQGGAGGTIGPGSATVAHGATTDLSITPDSGYRIDAVSGCGGTLSGNTYTTGAITGDCTVTASFIHTLALVPQGIKTFHFSWTAVSGVTGYKLLEDADGASGYAEIAAPAADATSHDLVVSLPARVNARYLLQACNGATCTDSAPVSVSGNLASAVGYLKAANAGDGDAFGSAIALSGDGNTLAVGAYAETSGDVSTTWAGAVYVFIREGDGWAPQAYLKASNPTLGDYFGRAVALSTNGDTLAVGAPLQDGGTADSGAVYVFTRNGGVWSEPTSMKAAAPGVDDRFGFAVALSSDGDTLVAGAPNDDETATNSGAIYLFTRSGAAWSPGPKLKASSVGANDAFGAAVAFASADDTFAVGAPYKDGAATDSGAAYLFVVGDSGWEEQSAIAPSDAAANDEFGTAVALAANGSTVAVGAPKQATSGAAYLFTRSGTVWSEQARAKAANAEVDDRFGQAVSLSSDGNTLAVGAFGEDGDIVGLGGSGVNNNLAGNSGAAYLFTRDGTEWSERSYVKASNTGADDYFGFALALSSDGSTLAVGAFWEDGIADDSGAVYLY